jgi:DNA invertase Pin-like site-specific DNA recombinase
MKGTKRIAIYARVSTKKGQDPAMQVDELKEYCGRRGWEIVGEYIDHGVSGSRDKRSALDQMMGDCRKRLVDAVIVYRYDRFARSLSHLVNSLSEFDGLGIDFISLHDGVDTTTANGRLCFGIFASIAQFERELICQRIASGLAAAKSRGQKLGRPSVAMLSEKQARQLKQERKQGKASLRALSKKYRIPVWRVHALCSGAKASV